MYLPVLLLTTSYDLSELWSQCTCMSKSWAFLCPRSEMSVCSDSVPFTAHNRGTGQISSMQLTQRDITVNLVGGKNHVIWLVELENFNQEIICRLLTVSQRVPWEYFFNKCLEISPQVTVYMVLKTMFWIVNGLVLLCGFSSQNKVTANVMSWKTYIPFKRKG